MQHPGGGGGVATSAGWVALPRQRREAFRKAYARSVRIRHAVEEAGVDHETTRESVSKAGGVMSGRPVERARP